MRHFTQRLMMAVVATFMAVGSLWAYSELPKSGPFTSAYYDYVAAETGTLVFHVTNNAEYDRSPSVYYDVVNFYDASVTIPPKQTRDINVPVYAGKNTFWLNSVSDCSYTLTEPGDDGHDGPDEVSGAGAQGSPYIIELGKKMPCGGAGDYIYYKYTATSNGRLMFDMSKVSSSTSVGYNTTSMTLDFSYWLYNYQEGISLSAGQSAYIFIGYNANNSENYVKFSFETLVEGETPASAISLSEGTNSGVNVFTDKDTWYKISVPANHKVSYSISTIFFNTNMYAGLANAEAKANAEADSQYSAGVASGSANNVTAGVVDYYIYVESGFTFGSSSVNITITFEDLSTLNNAKGIGTPAFSIANNANVAAATSSILVTFPNFQKGAQADYDIRLGVNLYCGMTTIYDFKQYVGTANNGVNVTLPTLEAGKTYTFTVVMAQVGDYLTEYPENSINFNVVNVADGSESNPFIITEAGVAGPDHGATYYGDWTWYKYIVPSDGKVTISHTWANASINTTGLIRVNGLQVASNVPNSWSQGCSADDVIMVAVATESRTDGYLIKGSVSEPAEGDVRATAKTLNVGSNTIAKVESGAMSNWYKFNLAANHEATLNFGLAIAAKYYVGSSVAGTNIENNTEGFTELSYVNDGTEAVDIYVEVTGTNDKTPVATLAIEELQASQAGSGTAADPYVIVLGEDMPCPTYGNTMFYVYTATEDGLLSMDNSQVSSSYPSFYYGSSASNCYNSFYPPYAMTTGQTVYISCNCSYDISSKTISFSFRAPEPGEVVSDPLILNEGSNTIAPLSGPAMWYKLTVPAKKTFSMNVPYGTFMYKGLTNATNESNGVAAEYNSGDYKFEGNNKEASSVDLYFKVNSNYGDFTCNIVFADYEELDFSHVTGSGTSSSMYNVIVDKIYPGGAYYAKKYYQYTADADCWFTVDVSNLSGSNSIYASTTKTNVTGSQYYNYSYSGGMQLNEGQSVYFRIEFYSDNSEKYVIFHAGEVPAGATPAKAHALVEGNNNIEAINEWYSIAVPAGATLTFEPQAYMSYSAYAGIADANAQSNYLALTYNSSTYASDLNYTNETGAELSVYIKPTYYYGATNCVLTLDIPAPATYERAVTPGYYGTICLEKKLVNYSGATFFSIAYIENEIIYLDEVLASELQAGMPYIFLAEADMLAGELEGEAAAAGNHNGLYGSFSTELLVNNGDNYVIYENQYRRAGAQTSVGAYRAYIQLNQVPTEPVAPSPSRRRVAMGTQGSQVTTNIENVNVGQSPNDNVNKLMIDGKLYIIRNNQMYNVNGQLVK